MCDWELRGPPKYQRWRTKRRQQKNLEPAVHFRVETFYLCASWVPASNVTSSRVANAEQASSCTLYLVSNILVSNSMRILSNCLCPFGWSRLVLASHPSWVGRSAWASWAASRLQPAAPDDVHRAVPNLHGDPQLHLEHPLYSLSRELRCVAGAPEQHLAERRRG